MRSQPNRNYKSDDNVMTPAYLAEELVANLRPRGSLLEPCAGAGAFVAALRPFGPVESCEITAGRSFFDWHEHVDWIVTNPPWSQFRRFLAHSLVVADHVAMMATVNHWWTRRRVAMVREAGFGYHRLLLFNPPPTFPSTGFELGMMVVVRGYRGPLHIEDLRPAPRS